MADGLQFDDAMKNAAFIFDSYTYETANQTLRLRYRFENGAAFEETIRFEPPSHELTPEENKALDASFRLIFLLAGVSYYKAYAPYALKSQACPIDPIMAAFLEKTYRNGLGEYSYRNTLDLSDRIRFEVDENAAPQSVGLPPGDTVLVPVGGGKDSAVTIECLKKAREKITLFALGNANGIAEPIADCIAVAGLPATKVARTLSANLMTLNAAGALNGHIPITAILSAIAVATAIMQGCRAVILSNEHSASTPNLTIGALEINHQYSKSIVFEKDFSAILASHVTPDIRYYSFLRPLSEVEIARRFAKLPAYHPAFRSCNTAFRQDDGRRNKNWCCDCPKCRFVFMALAPFVDKAKLIAIFGHNLLDDAAQTQGFSELCGITAFKPFECVGEVEECALLMQHLGDDEAWHNDKIVQHLAPQLKAQAGDYRQAYAALFKNRTGDCLSKRYREMLDACR